MAEQLTNPSAEYQKMKAGLDAWDVWEEMSEGERCEIILTKFAGHQWFEPGQLPILAGFKDDPIAWGRIKTIGNQIGVKGWDLDRAADAWLRQQRNGHEPHVARELPEIPPPLAPPLPTAAQLTEGLADDAAPWLEAYAAHSCGWSPRAAPGFHIAVGLWMLSTIAARRIRVEMGNAIYPTLFIALVARSTLYAKTTTAKIGIDALRQAGCGHLLASDRSTPQALLRSMAGYVPFDYGSRTPEVQETIARRVSFAAQRGCVFRGVGRITDTDDTQG